MSFFEALWTTMGCWIAWLVCAMKVAVIESCEFVLTAIVLAINVMLLVLPTFALEEPKMDSGVVGFLNYFIPLTMLTASFTAIMTAWILYRIFQWALKWAKAAD